MIFSQDFPDVCVCVCVCVCVKPNKQLLLEMWLVVSLGTE